MKRQTKSEMKIAFCETLANMMSPLAAYEYKEGVFSDVDHI